MRNILIATTNRDKYKIVTYLLSLEILIGKLKTKKQLE